MWDIFRFLIIIFNLLFASLLDIVIDVDKAYDGYKLFEVLKRIIKGVNKKDI